MIIATHRIETFRTRIKNRISLDEHGCWIWQGARHKNGYGHIGLGGGKGARAHRVSFEIFKAEIPEGLDVCHKCDVRACVNPDHLFLGTRSENLQDASAKGRLSRTHQLKGSKHPSAKLTEASVLKILERLKAGDPKARIAASYGVTDRIVLLISRGDLWRHVARLSP